MDTGGRPALRKDSAFVRGLICGAAVSAGRPAADGDSTLVGAEPPWGPWAAAPKPASPGGLPPAGHSKHLNLAFARGPAAAVDPLATLVEDPSLSPAWAAFAGPASPLSPAGSVATLDAGWCPGTPSPSFRALQGYFSPFASADLPPAATAASADLPRPHPPPFLPRSSSFPLAASERDGGPRRVRRAVTFRAEVAVRPTYSKEDYSRGMDWCLETVKEAEGDCGVVQEHTEGDDAAEDGEPGADDDAELEGPGAPPLVPQRTGSSGISVLDPAPGPDDRPLPDLKAFWPASASARRPRDPAGR
ncbi:hypothetical protein DFJ74DRAFT_682033 [Hyaloraphidium curvatum]|nr:hypothetical protein DFJ74DRAFT_682033 [Hyaloraphidium curvatum]